MGAIVGGVVGGVVLIAAAAAVTAYIIMKRRRTAAAPTSPTALEMPAAAVVCTVLGAPAVLELSTVVDAQQTECKLTDHAAAATPMTASSEA